MSTHSICFHGEIRKNLYGYSLLSRAMIQYLLARLYESRESCCHMMSILHCLEVSHSGFWREFSWMLEWIYFILRLLFDTCTYKLFKLSPTLSLKMSRVQINPVMWLYDYSLFLVFEMKWFFISYFWINVGNRNSKIQKKMSFLIQFKNERLTEILQTVRCHILWSY